MAITIDWGTKVINIPRLDLQLVQSVPTEIRQLDIDNFRQILNDLQDDPVGMAYPTTHQHVQPISVGGVTLARIVEIINGYTVTFEDGQYAVNLVGANANIGDVANVNQVSIRSANSAGLTYSKQVEDQSFTDSRVWVDTLNGLPGTEFPRGTPGDPVNNLLDAQQIIEDRRLPKRLTLRGNIDLLSGQSLSNYDILGVSNILANISIDPSANTENLIVQSVTLQGTLSGNLTAKQSTSLTSLGNFEGTMSDCGIDGTINIADNATVIFEDCYSEVAGLDTPIIVMGVNSTLILRNYSGGVEVRNMTAGCVASVDLDPGTLVVGSTNTGGTLRVRGTGVVKDTTNGTVIAKDSLVKADELDLLFFDRKVSYDEDRGTVGETNFPAGTSGRPVATESDLRTIADNIGVRSYQILGALTLSQAHVDWEFNGTGGSTARVNLAGQDVSGAKFQGLNVQGSMVAETGIIEARNGPFGNVSGLRGTVVECGVFGTISFGTAPNVNRFVRCQQGNSAPTFDCTNIGAASGIIFALWDGQMTITNLTEGFIVIDGLGADIIIDSSCTGGSILIRGAGNVTNNSAGTSVDTTQLIQEQVASGTITESDKDDIAARIIPQIWAAAP